MTLTEKYQVATKPRPKWNSNGKNIFCPLPDQLIEDGNDFAPNDYRSWPDIAIDHNNYIHLVYTGITNHNGINGMVCYRRLTHKGYGSPDDNFLNIGALITLVGTDAAFDQRNCSFCFIPPIPVTLPNGRLIVTYTKLPIADGAVRSKWSIYSDDITTVSDPTTATWSSPSAMTTDYADPGMIDGPGSGVYRNGVVYFTLYARPDKVNSERAPVLYKSTDLGITYTKVRDIYPQLSVPTRDYEEPTSVFLGNGLFIGILRSDPLARTYVVYSPDSGANFSDPIIAFPSVGKNPVCITPNGTLVGLGRYSLGLPIQLQRAIFWWSSDGGKTFQFDYLDWNRIDVLNVYEYGGVCYHPVVKKIIAISAVDIGSGFQGPTQIFAKQLTEV